MSRRILADVGVGRSVCKTKPKVQEHDPGDNLQPLKVKFGGNQNQFTSERAGRLQSVRATRSKKYRLSKLYYVNDIENKIAIDCIIIKTKIAAQRKRAKYREKNLDNTQNINVLL
jgi:hypothetical protein